MLSPIVLFVYNRPWHAEQTLNALMQNELADQSILHIYADGPKEEATDEQLTRIEEVRKVIRSKKWCKEIHIIEADNNKGLADSIIVGVTEIVNQYGKVIVLEDDIVTSKGFLRYMNQALELYEKVDEVMSVSAFMFPINFFANQETFFYAANSCWGWGTWKEAWCKYNNNALELYLKLIEKRIDWERFNAFQGNAFKEQLLANVENSINTWAVKWHSVIHLNSATVLHPKKSLVRNIGFDGSGVNCRHSPFEEELELAETLCVKKEEVKENPIITTEIKKYFSRTKHADLSGKPSAENLSLLDAKIGNQLGFRNLLKIGLARFKKQKLKEPKLNAFLTNSEYKRLIALPRFASSSVTLFGKKVTIVDSTTFLSSLQEIFVDEIYRIGYEKENVTVVDCGANIGLATIYFKKEFPAARILSYEADPKIFAVLKENLISFGYNDVQVFNTAVSDCEGIINFKMEGGHSGMITDEGIAENIVPVKTIRLKKVLEELEEITFLKIDIEGHEINVIPDIEQELAKVKYLFLEYHSFIDKEQQLDYLLSGIKEAGFKYYIKESADKKYPFIQKELFLKMDLLVNIFCYRDY